VEEKDKNTALNYIERWRKVQRKRDGERLFATSVSKKEKMRKFFTPKQFDDTFIKNLEGKLFLACLGSTNNMKRYFYNLFYSGFYYDILIEKSQEIPMFAYYKKIGALKKHYKPNEQNKVKNNSIVMATGQVCMQTKITKWFEDRPPLRFMEVIGPNSVGYIEVSALTKVAKQ